MAYRVLALKWRPTGFLEVVAQDHVTQTLKNSISGNRIANAYLFAGPRGIGKTTTARIFSKALNCKNGPSPEPCDQCTHCKEITAGRSLDVLEIDGASNRGIDEIRNLRENVRYAPSSSKFKIYIVDEVHMLTTEAFNALLKTLEEPPGHVRFVFATTEPHKLPATILSRCQRFDFKRIPLEQLIEQLRMICRHEKIQIDDDSLFLIAKKADGSMRDGESLLDQMISYCGNEIKIEEVLDALSVVSQDLLFEITDIIERSNIQAGLEFVDRLIDSGYDVTEFLQSLVEHLRNLLFANTVEDGRLLETSENYKQRFFEVGKKFTHEDLLRMIQIVSDAELAIKRSPNPRIRLELCIIKLIKLDRSVTLDDIINRLSKPGGQPELSSQSPDSSSSLSPLKNEKSVPTVAAAETQKKNLSYPSPTNPDQGLVVEEKTSPSESENVERIPASLEQFKRRWEEIVRFVQTRRLYVSVFLKEGQPLRFEENILEVGFSEENGFQIEAIKRNKEVVLQAIQEIMGVTVAVKFVRSRLDQAKPEEAGKSDEQQKPQSPEVDPMVERIIKIFDGELITGG
jgi:DNA polymerase-3 subunit gamma/tau